MLGAEAILKTLELWNVKYIFGCPGTTEVPILDAMVNYKRPEFILCVHECVAVSAADGYARVTGGPGIATLHANIGLANGISHLHNANLASSPILIINFIKSRRLLGRRGFTVTHDHQEMVKQYTKWDWQVLTKETLVEDLERCLRLAITPPKGPTYLAVPQDILEAELGDVKMNGRPKTDLISRPSYKDIEKAAEILSEANFPLIISGAGVAQENVLDFVVRLAKRWGMPVCSENRLNLDYSSYPTEEDHFVGLFHPDSAFIKEADVILALGCKLFIEFESPKKPWVEYGKKLIHLNPDVKEIGHIYPVEVGLSGSLTEGVRDIMSALEERLKGKEGLIVRREKKVYEFHKDFIKRRNEYFETTEGSSPLRISMLVKELSNLMNQKITIVADAVTSNEPIAQYLPRYNSNSFYASSSGGSLGWGMGAAIGIKMGLTEQSVLCITGDGSFIFGLPSLHTVYKYKIPVGFIIINNSSYAAVKAGLLRYKGEAAKTGIFPGTDIGGPDYTHVAKGFGINSYKISSKEDLKILSEIIGKEESFLIEVITDPKDVGRVER